MFSKIAPALVLALSCSTVPALASSSLDLTDSVQSIRCSPAAGSAADVSVTYQRNQDVLLTVKNETQRYRLLSLKNGVAGEVELLAQSPATSLHLLLTVRTDGGRSLLQVNGGSAYLTCEVTNLQ